MFTIYRKKDTGTRAVVKSGFNDYETAGLCAADAYKNRKDGERIELECTKTGESLPFLSEYDIADKNYSNFEKTYINALKVSAILQKRAIVYFDFSKEKFFFCVSNKTFYLCDGQKIFCVIEKVPDYSDIFAWGDHTETEIKIFEKYLKLAEKSEKLKHVIKKIIAQIVHERFEFDQYAGKDEVVTAFNDLLCEFNFFDSENK